MAASRLSDAQKDEIVAGYRQGATAAALASAFGCSPNTVSRVVKAALAPEELAALKQQRGKGEPGGGGPVAPAAAVLEAPLEVDAPPEETPLDAEEAPLDAEEIAVDEDSSEAAVGAAAGDDADGPGVLAIDDADDFAGDDVDQEADQEADELDGLSGDEGPAAVATATGLAGQEPVQCRCLSEAELPASAYLLVDKTVELQPVALSDCPDLGPLPEEEALRQALQVYVNPRTAKRQCGRSQRVIPLPDLSLLQRTAPYLLAQGISRVVIEGSLYSLPGS
jgi:hypothetical protein